MASNNPNGKSGIDSMVERYAGMKEEITAIRASSSSSDHSVTVVAGPGGAVLDIKITDAAMHGSAQALGGAIMSALRLAVADGARQQAAIVQRYVGDRLNIVERVMATQKEILGDKIQAGEEEEARLKAQQQAAVDDGRIMRSEPLARPTWQQPTPQPAPHSGPPAAAPGWQQPPAQTPRPRPRQHEITDDDEGFQGIGGSDRR